MTTDLLPIAAFTLRDLPGFNACMNALSTVFIILGWIFISREMKRAHITMMVGALVSSTIFLAGYLVYHFNVPVTKFEETGLVRYIYFFILFSHIVLAAVVLPLVFMTVIPALRSRFDRHRKVGRWTMPLWLYVSVTGVLVYLMLYRWFPPSTLISSTL